MKQQVATTTTQFRTRTYNNVFALNFDSRIKLKVLINLIQNTYVCLPGGNKYCEPISNLKTIANMKMHFFIS